MISPTLPLPPVSDLPSSVGALFGVWRPQFGTISSWKRLELGSQDFSFQMFHTVDLDSVAALFFFTIYKDGIEMSSTLLWHNFIAHLVCLPSKDVCPHFRILLFFFRDDIYISGSGSVHSISGIDCWLTLYNGSLTGFSPPLHLIII